MNISICIGISRNPLVYLMITSFPCLVMSRLLVSTHFLSLYFFTLGWQWGWQIWSKNKDFFNSLYGEWMKTNLLQDIFTSLRPWFYHTILVVIPIESLDIFDFGNWHWRVMKTLLVSFIWHTTDNEHFDKLIYSIPYLYYQTKKITM